MKNLILILSTTLLLISSNSNISVCASNKTPTDPEWKLTEVWSTAPVLTTCESVLYDNNRNVLFVSCIKGNPSEKDRKGFISLLDTNGKIKKLEWVSGLNAPKGMGIIGNNLFVTDIDQLVVIDIDKAKISKRINIEGAYFLNDVAVDRDGKVYFTDSDTGIIWIYSNGEAKSWITEGLNRPNGLYIEDDRVLLTSSGSQDLRVINKASGKSEIVTTEIGRGDGIASTGKKGYYLTSSWTGEIFLIFPDFTKVSLLKTSDQKINSADIGFNIKEQVVYVPTFFDNRVVAYKLEKK